MMRIGTAGAVVAVMTCVLSSASAQRSVPGKPAADTEAVSRVVGAAVRTLSLTIASSMFDAKAAVWEIGIPDTADAAWRKARAGLQAILHSRPRRRSDHSYRSLQFGPLLIRGDSLFGSFTYSWNDYCPPSPTLVMPAGGGWSGGSSSSKLVSVRQSGHWQDPVIRGGDETDGGCLHRGGS